MSAPRFVRPLRELDLDARALVGDTNARLGALLTDLAPAGVRVPDGFAITTEALRHVLGAARLEDELAAALDRVDPDDAAALARTARLLRERIRTVRIPDDLAAEVTTAYDALSRARGELAAEVAVRSSAVADDAAGAASIGLHDSVLGVRGPEAVLAAARVCMASLFTERAIRYRHAHGIPHRTAGLAVCVQTMVRSDLASAGVILTLDPDSGFRDVVEVSAAWGLGGAVVDGRVSPDVLTIHKPTLARGRRPIVRRVTGTKPTKWIRDERGTHEEPVPAEDRRAPSVTDDEALTLARWAVAIEDHHAAWSGTPAPMQIAWAKDGRSGELFVVQARPAIVHARRAPPAYERVRIRGTPQAVVTGTSVGTRIGQGTARVVREPAELDAFRDGEILVAVSIDPDWEPVLARAAAIVVDGGSRTCHAAIAARELGIACVVGTGAATEVLHTGDALTVSCAEGAEGRVYRGPVEYERTTIDPSTLPPAPIPVMLNLGDPSNAFVLGALPSAGVGLVRIEFLVSLIGIHPMALAHPERIRDPRTRRELAARTSHLAVPSELFVDRLATGIAQIAAAFYPRPVIVRFSDFKSNEYAGLLGGKDFELAGEVNPMLGFRGASRYYDPRYRDGFALECAAIRRVRTTMGLTNVKVMVPFCRTLGEARRVLDVLAANGLRRGQDDLEVLVMCEVPNNIVLAAELSELFDGFSIGSNDLTQLVLGIDRDSALLATLFDEEDLGVKRSIAELVATAHRHGRPVGFCGQAPSDHLAYAAFLVALGIDSISVTPDAWARVVLHLTEPRPDVPRTADPPPPAHEPARPSAL